MSTHTDRPGALEVRPARREDLPQLVNLCADHAAFERSAYDAGGKAERLEHYLFEQRRAHCLVLDGPDGLAGYATFCAEFSTWDAGEYLHMDCLYLRPEARNGGHGARLLARIAAFALEGGFLNVQWQSPEWNEGGERFYRRQGATAKAKNRFFLTRKACQALARRDA